MRSRDRGLAVAVLVAAACGGSSTPSGDPAALINVLPITVNGASCSTASYPNKPCVSLTVCAPGTTTCQTIDDILLDTGSTGVRIFSQALTIPLAPVTVPSGTLAECAQWGDASSDWGPVRTATVILGDEPPVRLPIHVIDHTFATPPAGCATPDLDPASAGFNGILGVGLFQQDCGSGCATVAANGVYYACTGAACSGTLVDLATQVQNPVGLFPVDNNGVIVNLPPVPSGGTTSITGSLLFGIGTRSNNAPSNATLFNVDANGYLATRFSGASYPAYIDTGSNGLFFPPPPTSLPACSPPADAWFCPPSTVSLQAVNSGASGGASSTISFQIANYVTLLSTRNSVFDRIGGGATTQGGFDWGLPFHFGRRVYVGLEGQPSALGSGPYFAY